MLSWANGSYGPALDMARKASLIGQKAESEPRHQERVVRINYGIKLANWDWIGASQDNLDASQLRSIQAGFSSSCFWLWVRARKLFPASAQISWPKVKCRSWGQVLSEDRNCGWHVYYESPRRHKSEVEWSGVARGLSSVQIQLKLTFSNETNANCRLAMTNVRRQSDGSSRIFMCQMHYLSSCSSDRLASKIYYIL